MGRGYNNLGESYKLRGEWTPAIECFEKQIEAARQAQYPRWEAWALFTMGECYAKKGDTDRGLECCKSAQKILATFEDKVGMAAVHRNYGIIYRLREEWDTSLKHFEKSIATYEKLDIPFYHAYALYEFGLMHKDKGEREDARRCLDRALKMFTTIEAKMNIIHVERELKEL
ncbi:MAG: tetratricopeptide repeat protein [Thermoplasmata archaeon]|nr:tetratricopeptide repeat protein [Thermoplasmata archaeon]